MKRIIKEIRLLAVKNSAYEIINKKHATYYGMAMSVKRICEVIMRNEKSILPVSHIIHGVYDIDGVLKEVSYRALPAALVEKVKVDVGEMEIGDTIRVKDLSIAKDKDVDILTDLEAVVATVTAVHNNVPETDEEADAEEAK